MGLYKIKYFSFGYKRNSAINLGLKNMYGREKKEGRGERGEKEKNKASR